MWQPFTWRRAPALIAALLALFVAFEVGVRLIEPDAVTYDIQTIEPAGPPGPHLHGEVTDPATIARWRAAITAHSGDTILHAYEERWQSAGCANGTEFVVTYTFTWHGLPVEDVTNGPSCAGGYEVSHGGLPNWNLYLIDPLPQR